MNDFKKEELIEILNGLDDFYLAHSPFKLREKIQSMIDNYPQECSTCKQEGSIYTFVIEGKIFRGWSCDACGNMFKVVDNE